MKIFYAVDCVREDVIHVLRESEYRDGSLIEQRRRGEMGMRRLTHIASSH